MTENTTTGKKKHFRLLPLISGLFILYFCFFSIIPSSLLSGIFSVPISDVSLEFLTVDNIHYYVWGYTDSAGIVTDFNNLSISDAISFVIWIITILSGIFLLMSSSYKSKPKNMKKLMFISIFFLIIDLFYHLTLFFNLGYNGRVVGIGNGIYYLSSTLVLIYLGFLRVDEYFNP